MTPVSGLRDERLRHSYPPAGQHIGTPQSARTSIEPQEVISALRGHYNYFGVNGNVESLVRLAMHAKRAWYKWLNRRSQRSRLNWERFEDLYRDYPLQHPAALYSCGVDEPRAISAEEPDGGNLHVRIWRGPELGNWLRLLYQHSSRP